MLKTNRVRADTTVIEANVDYPSDSCLLSKGVARMTSAAKKLRAMVFATPGAFGATPLRPLGPDWDPMFSPPPGVVFAAAPRLSSGPG